MPEFSEIDRLIEGLNQVRDYEASLAGLDAIGEPALRRLVQVIQGKPVIPLGKYPIDAATNRIAALAQLGRSHVESLLEALEGVDIPAGSIFDFTLREIGGPKVSAFLSGK